MHAPNPRAEPRRNQSAARRSAAAAQSDAVMSVGSGPVIHIVRGPASSTASPDALHTSGLGGETLCETYHRRSSRQGEHVKPPLGQVSTVCDEFRILLDALSPAPDPPTCNPVASAYNCPPCPTGRRSPANDGRIERNDRPKHRDPARFPETRSPGGSRSVGLGHPLQGTHRWHRAAGTLHPCRSPGRGLHLPASRRHARPALNATNRADSCRFQRKASWMLPLTAINIPLRVDDA